MKENEPAIVEAERLHLTTNHYYHTLLGELYKAIDKTKAKEHFMHALRLAKSDTDKSTILNKIDVL